MQNEGRGKSKLTGKGVRDRIRESNYFTDPRGLVWAACPKHKRSCQNRAIDVGLTENAWDGDMEVHDYLKGRLAVVLGAMAFLKKTLLPLFACCLFSNVFLYSQI